MLTQQWPASAHLHQHEQWWCNAAFRGADRQSGRLDAPRDRTSPECPQPPAGAVQGLQVSRGDVLEHLLLKRQIGHQTLKTNILALQVLHALCLIDLKAAIFLAPAVITLLRYPCIPAGDRRSFALRHRHFNLAKHRHNLLRTKPLLWHVQAPFQAILSHRLVQKSQVRSECPLEAWLPTCERGLKWPYPNRRSLRIA